MNALLVYVLAALIPTIIGMIYYNPKVMGGIWMDASGMTEKKIQSGNMPLIFGLSFVLAFLLSWSMTYVLYIKPNSIHFLWISLRLKRR
jgi:hypothetical protein